MNKVIASIIVPCFNQGEYLREAIKSVLDQDYHYWECIILDDGSNDYTAFYSAQYVKMDSRFRYYYQENSGVCSARNVGIELAKGEYILPLDADDKISPEYLKFALMELESNIETKLVYCRAEKFGEVKGEWKLGEFSLKNLAVKNMIFCSAVFRKKDAQSIGGYDLNMGKGLEDWEFWISLLKNGGGVTKLNIIGFYYRIKIVSRTTQINNKKYRELFRYLSIKHADFFVNQLGSFMELKEQIEKMKEENTKKMKSPKFVFKLFCNKFFGYPKM